MRIFALFIGIIAIYISSAFVRLELFASVGLIILGSIGLTILTQKIFQQEKQNLTKIVFPTVIIILFIIPVALPENNSWVNWSDFSPSILSGGSHFTKFASDDWNDTMLWIKQNTPEDAVIASWWDYGYWITTLSERTTLADNATLIDWQIKKIGYSLITSPENSWHILNSHYTEDISPYLGEDNIVDWGGETQNDFIVNHTTRIVLDRETSYDQLSDDEQKLVDTYIIENGTIDCNIIPKSEAQEDWRLDEESCHPVPKGMDADYLLIYLAGERFYTQNSNIPLYTLEGGGDESKKTWYVKISNHQLDKYLESDNITPTKYYMEKSTLGMLTPFSIYKYVEPNTGRTFDQFQIGLIPVYVSELKFKDPENDPFYLVYASPSYYSQDQGPMSAVLVYKINHDYNPKS
tara:strand:+ start:190 stop:1410 length:1221 start_codon:yes stop_codon:yes gene_type:complete